jgi:hypothetical protein
MEQENYNLTNKKDICASCDKRFNNTVKNYLIAGNYCPHCMDKINKMSRWRALNEKVEALERLGITDKDIDVDNVLSKVKEKSKRLVGLKYKKARCFIDSDKYFKEYKRVSEKYKINGSEKLVHLKSRMKELEKYLHQQYGVEDMAYEDMKFKRIRSLLNNN